MGKQIKLNTNKNSGSKQTKKHRRETRFFFVKDQGEGAVRVLIIIFKLLELIITTIFALCLGILAPLSLMMGEPDEIIFTSAAVPWIISSVLYIIGLFLMIFNCSKTGTGVHISAGICSLVTYNNFRALFRDHPEYRTPAHLFMPCLIITALSVAIMLMVNVPVWWERYIRKQNEKAPSILGDDNND